MAIGLDIGSSAVRLAELEQRRGRTRRLTRYGEAPLPPGAVVDGDVVEATVVADALRKLWDSTGVRGRNVAVGLASQRVSVRQIDLPDLPDDDLAAAVRLQAQDQLPIPIDQALLDYVVIDRYSVGDERRNVRVLLVAAECDMVERLLTAVTAAGLRPVLVDLDAFALVRSLATTPEPGPDAVADEEAELIVDIGATLTKIAVHRGGRPLFVRMVRRGGDASTRDIQKVLDLSWEEAEKSKLDASAAMAAGVVVDPEDERARVLQDAAERVITEVRNSLDFFRSQHEGEEVQRVLLSGGASLAPQLAEKLHAALELPVGQGDPLRTIDATHCRGEHVNPQEQGPFLAVPVGLALGLLA